MNRLKNVAIVGATGAVGREMLDVLEGRRFAHGELTLLASSRSAGQTLRYRGEPHTVRELTKDSFKGVDIALFSAGGSISKQFCPIAVATGTMVIDNSSAFRMDPAVPLVVPEVNPRALDAVRGKAAIIANPNCSTIIMLMAVNPLRSAFGIKRIAASTYQAVSGAGAAAMDELAAQAKAVLGGGKAEANIFHEQCAFNVFSHNSAMDPRTGRNLEEQKMVDESRKIWGDQTVRITATCVRVPVMRAHAEAINLTLSKPATEKQVREALAKAPGVEIVDDRAKNLFPTSLKASGKDDVLVGRIRVDESQDFETRGGEVWATGFDLFIAGDQLRKGAALNAVQIAELL
jgi:aspartate-semialdehyde dehydrogenase